MHYLLASILAFATFSANAITIGSFGPNSVNYGGADLESGSAYRQLQAEFLRRGDTVKSLDTFNGNSLSDIDVFYTGLPNGIQRQSAGELASLLDWVQAGGTFISAGEYDLEFDRYNNLLAPFGVQLTSNLAYWGTATVSNFSSPITNGPNGMVPSFNFYAAGGFSGEGIDVLAREAGAPILIHKTIGRGQLIAIGDQNQFTDQYLGANEKTLFLNMLDSAAVAAIPEPTESALLVSGLLMLGGVTRSRRKKQSA